MFHSTVCNAGYFARYSVQCMVFCTIQCAVYVILHYPACSALYFALFSVQCTVFCTIQCTVHWIGCSTSAAASITAARILSPGQCKALDSALYTLHSTVYSERCTVHKCPALCQILQHTALQCIRYCRTLQCSRSRLQGQTCTIMCL